MSAAHYYKNPKFCDDTVLQNVNRFVSLNNYHKKRNTAHLNFIMKELLPIMKNKDKTFNRMYNSIMYGGSYYKGTKVEEPNEYDLNLIIKIQEMPLQLEMVKTKPGYVKIKTTNYRRNLLKNDDGSAFDNIINEDGYLDQNKFRSWLESVLHKTICSLPPSTPHTKYIISKKDSGPAQNLTVKIRPLQNFDEYIINVDLVGCLQFSFDKPLQGFNCPEGNCVAIPKPLPDVSDGNLLWRVCFYEQEKELLSSKCQLKTLLRLLKKLRNTQKLSSLCSYYIETVFLHEIKSQKASFWNDYSLTCLFMHMLIKLQKAVYKCRIPFFWCKKMNLMNISQEMTKNIAYRLKKIINKINLRIDSDPLIIARFILNEEELENLRI